MENQQRPSALLLVRPASFGFNSQTAESNVFQQNEDLDTHEMSKDAQQEFDNMLRILKSNDIQCKVVEDTRKPKKPDAVFPNNWISFHADGKVILYPMMAENRRSERRSDILELLKRDYMVSDVIDLTHYEKRGRFLEGTGSIVFDHVNKIAFACRSGRTDEGLFKEVCEILKYKPVIFKAVDQKGKAIYHTNVIMVIGTKFAIICLDAMHGEDDQDTVLQIFASTNHKVIAISYEQMWNFAGNIFEVTVKHGDAGVLISQRAFNSLVPGQIDALSKFAELIPIDINTIETYGGGSVRCMVAGIHLPKR